MIKIMSTQTSDQVKKIYYIKITYLQEGKIEKLNLTK